MSHPHPTTTVTLQGCQLLLVQDQPQVCPYLDDTVARMPLRLPVGEVSDQVVDSLLESGFRRSGDFVYMAECPTCKACQPTRVQVDEFAITRSMKRVWNRCEKNLSTQWQTPLADADHTRLFNEHRRQRNLGREDEQVDVDSYRSFLINRFCTSRELAVFDGDELIAVSIIDVGAKSLSAVYTHFNPDFDKYSLGTYAILKHFQYAREHHKEFLYLGMYVAQNRHLNYKARFLPQQRLIEGVWTDVTCEPKECSKVRK